MKNRFFSEKDIAHLLMCKKSGTLDKTTKLIEEAERNPKEIFLATKDAYYDL